MEIRGVRLKKQNRYTKNSGFYVLKEPECFSVPLLADDGDKPERVVNIGDIVKEGTLIAKPSGKYSSFVYSPCAGKVIGIVKKLNVSGNQCEHIVILRDLSNEKEYFRPLEKDEQTQESLLKRLYESGMIDSFEPFDPAYKKYLLRNRIKELVINCTEDDPYKTCDSALIETYYSEIIEGAKYFQKVCKAENLIFIFTRRQKVLAKMIKKHVKNLNEQKNIVVKMYPDIYPLHDSRLIGYYETRKMVPDGSRTAEAGVIVESPSNCYDFYMAINKGMPCIQKAVTIAGNNCIRKANYFIKNGTSIEHILTVVGTKEDYAQNTLIYGGVMTGIAQETLDISATLTASSILVLDLDQYTREVEKTCISCGKCLACCPVKLNVKDIDDAVAHREYTKAKKLGVTACIGCGACSYVCPSKRFLAQRLMFAKDLALGKRVKDPTSSEYVLVEGEDINSKQTKKDKILSVNENFELPHDSGEVVPAIDVMLERLNQENKIGGGNND